jgi:hypothetical protein
VSSSHSHVNGDRNSDNNHQHPYTISPKIEIILLLSLLAILLILSLRPFGFRTFLIGLGREELYPMVIVFGITGDLLVLLQRLGLIFAEGSEDRYAQ